MSILFNQEVGRYLRETREHEPTGLSELRSTLARLDERGEEALKVIPRMSIGDDAYVLNIGNFMVTLVKRSNGDFLVTDITKSLLASDLIDPSAI